MIGSAGKRLLTPFFWLNLYGYQLLEERENPIIHEKRSVWEFHEGPIAAEVGPDCVVTHGSNLKPASLRMEARGGMLFLQTASRFSVPNRMPPKDWPTQSAVTSRYWGSQSTYATKIADVANHDILSAPPFCQFQNIGSWHPWLGIGQRSGCTNGKAYMAAHKPS